MTLPPRLNAAAGLGGSIVFVDGDVHTRVPWAEIHADALDLAAGLQALGVGPGTHVAILGPTSRHVVTAIRAIWMAGSTVVVLPLPMRMGSIEEFVDQTRTRIHGADVTLVLVDAQLAPFITPVPGDPPMVELGSIDGSTRRFVAPEEDPERLAVLQFTSGSTAHPKGVMLPHRVVTANLDAIREATEYDPTDDVIVSWLPLYHDLGLIGILTLAMTFGGELVLGAPQDFMASPSRWMEWLSRYRATATAGPNFSYVLATRALKRLENLDLSRLRVALNGAEPVNPEAVQAFVDAGARHGMRPGAIFPAFGMAELAIAGTFPPPMRGMVIDTVDQRMLETERVAVPVEPGSPGSRQLVKLGHPVPGLQIRIVDQVTGAVRGDREVGELEIRGSSVMPGYYRRPEETAETFHDGWLRTGDLAYTVDGEMVMCGRIKDLIIVAGRNVYPQDIELAVGEVDGVRAGNVIAFGVEGRGGKEAVVVVAEAKGGDLVPVRARVAETVRRTVGMPAKDIVLVAPGTLPKTSSGKLQRSVCRERYLGEALDLVSVA